VRYGLKKLAPELRDCIVRRREPWGGSNLTCREPVALAPKLQAEIARVTLCRRRVIEPSRRARVECSDRGECRQRSHRPG
jgi:hypothetical protein